MKIIFVEGIKPTSQFASSSWGLADIINGKMTKVCDLNYCRAFMGDALFALKNPTSKRTPCFPIDKEYNFKTGDTFVLFQVRDENILKIIQKNLSFLHEREKKAKVKLSVIHATQNPNIFIMQGSGHWKNSCWKQLLYTFYIKCLYSVDPKTSDRSYWAAIEYENNEDILLSKIKIRTEIFDKKVFGENLNKNVHDLEGFVRICNGYNVPMKKLLGVKTKQEVYPAYGC